MSVRSLLFVLSLFSFGCDPSIPSTTTDDDTNIGVDTSDHDTSDTNDTNDTSEPFTFADCDGPDGTFFGAMEQAVVTTTPYSVDAGIGALMAEVGSLSDGSTADSLEIVITDAVVTAVGYTPVDGKVSSFWFEDSNGAMRTYLQTWGDTPAVDESLVPTGEEIAPGMLVSMSVKAVKNYNGELEVTNINSAITVTDPATANVFVHEVTAALDYATDGRKLIHTYGAITEQMEVECGTGYQCFLLDNGFQNMTFRVKESKGVQVEDCVEVVAPFSTFGARTPADQIDISDFDWMNWL